MSACIDWGALFANAAFLVFAALALIGIAAIFAVIKK
jgi:hypothetical protein